MLSYIKKLSVQIIFASQKISPYWQTDQFVQ